MTTNELAQVLQAFVPKQPTNSFGPNEWIAIAATIIALVSVFIAYYALRDSRRSAVSAERSANAANTANDLMERISKRVGVIELHHAWHGVCRFDQNNPVFPDAINAANALDLTASLWNHDVLEKEILYQSYWKPFKEIYNTLSQCQLLIPKDGRRISDLVSSAAVTLAYRQMEALELQKVSQTSLKKG